MSGELKRRLNNMLEMDEDTQPTGKDVFGEKGNQTVTA